MLLVGNYDKRQNVFVLVKDMLRYYFINMNYKQSM